MTWIEMGSFLMGSCFSYWKWWSVSAEFIKLWWLFNFFSIGTNLRDQQLQQIVDKTIIQADKDGDGKISFDEFKTMVENTDIVKSGAFLKLDALWVLVK